MASKYEPNEQKTFRCVDGAGQIPYEHLNDDYCDCADGSDEPGKSELEIKWWKGGNLIMHDC